MCKVIIILYIYALCRVDLCTYLHGNSVRLFTHHTPIKEYACVSLPRVDGIKKIGNNIAVVPSIVCHVETKFAARRGQRQRSETSRKCLLPSHCAGSFRRYALSG